MLSDAKYSSTKGSSVLPQSSQQAKLMSSQVSSGPPSVVGNSVPMVQTAVISSGGSGSSKLIPQYQPIKSIMNYHNHHPSAYNYHHNAYNLNSSSNQSIPPPQSSSNFQQHPIHYHHHSHAQYPHAHHHLLNVVSPMNGGSINGGGSSSSNGSNNLANNSNNNGLNCSNGNNSSNNAKKYSSKTLASSSSSSTNSSTSSTGSVNVKFSGFFKDKIDEREKYLTAKYPNHQMALIKKRLKVEFWIDEQVKNLFSANDDNSKEDYDICADDLVDNLLDMESDNERRYFILNELSKAKKGRDEIMVRFV